MARIRSPASYYCQGFQGGRVDLERAFDESSPASLDARLASNSEAEGGCHGERTGAHPRAALLVAARTAAMMPHRRARDRARRPRAGPRPAIAADAVARGVFAIDSPWARRYASARGSPGFSLAIREALTGNDRAPRRLSSLLRLHDHGRPDRQDRWQVSRGGRMNAVGRIVRDTHLSTKETGTHEAGVRFLRIERGYGG